MSFLDRTRGGIEAFVERHRGSVAFLSALFVAGVVFGSLAVRSLDVRDKLELVQYLGAGLERLRGPQEGLSPLVLRQSLGAAARLVALLWVLGISVAGVLGVMVLALLRGFVTGFSVAFLAAEMGAKGVVLALTAHVPHSLFDVPALILGGAASIGFAGEVLRLWRERRRAGQFYQALGPYTLSLLGVGALLAVGALVESYISPTLIQAAARYLSVH